jgi:hypothetical protein
MRDRARYEPIARQAATVAGYDPDLFVAQITLESGWDTEAVSPAGAIGIAQIIPRWHPSIDPRDPVASLQYAANLMASYVREFGSERLALQAYNGGPSSLRATGTPPPGTAGYAQSLLDARDAMRAAGGGGSAGNDAAYAAPAAPAATYAAPDAAYAAPDETANKADSALAVLASNMPVDRRWAALLAAAAALVLFVAVTD